MATTTTLPARSGGNNEPPQSAFSYAGLVDYLNGVREELKKAIWPTREELYQLTKVVLVIIFLIAIYCGVLDSVLTKLTNMVFNIG